MLKKLFYIILESSHVNGKNSFQKIKSVNITFSNINFGHVDYFFSKIF